MPVKHIPIHSLKDINKSGIEIRHIVSLDQVEHEIYGAHRDDHYLFFFQQEGFSKLMVDFKEINGIGSWLFFILPGQVHQLLANNNCKGWFMALSPEHINENYRTVFEELIVAQQPVSPSASISKQLHLTFSLLEEICNHTEDFRFQPQIIYSLIDTCMGFYATTYHTDENEQKEHNLRQVIVNRQFRVAIRKNFKTIKSPSMYAAILNISPSYLNEVIKQQTGFNVSYWIHHEIISEAKRLLYYTNSSIKEIAHSLGYVDHAYFSRLFSKVTAQSPLQFRTNYRK